MFKFFTTRIQRNREHEEFLKITLESSRETSPIRFGWTSTNSPDAPSFPLRDLQAGRQGFEALAMLVRDTNTSIPSDIFFFVQHQMGDSECSGQICKSHSYSVVSGNRFDQLGLEGLVVRQAQGLDRRVACGAPPPSWWASSGEWLTSGAGRGLSTRKPGDLLHVARTKYHAAGRYCPH